MKHSKYAESFAGMNGRIPNTKKLDTRKLDKLNYLASDHQVLQDC